MSTVTSSLQNLPGVNDPLSSGSTSTASNELGKDAFLKLLTAQMQNQDPLNPTDNQAFVAQLAQFSSLEQMQNVSSKLDTLALAAASGNQLQAASLVGKGVRFAATQLGLTASGSSPLSVTLDGAATATSVVITDSTGKVVRTLQLGAHDAGTFDAAWDGLDDKGNRLPAGVYGMSVAGTTAAGDKVSATASVSGLVSGVTFDGGVAKLVVNGQTITLSQVAEISTPTSTSTSTSTPGA